MLINSKQLFGNSLAALDGNIGHVKDLFFDDEVWVVRYVVADTGTWLTSRLVLLSPHAFGGLDDQAKELSVRLTKGQIEESPPIDTHQPVSRQYEIDYFRYYGWPTYWNGGAMWGMAGYPFAVAPVGAEIEKLAPFHHRADKHLRSAKEIDGYDIQARDGLIGNVSGLMLNLMSWAVTDIVVDTGHWYCGKEIRIRTSSVERISYEDSKVFVSLTLADIRHTADNAVAHAGSPAPLADLVRD